MAKKNKRAQQKKPQRGNRPPVRTPAVSPVVPTAPAADDAPASGPTAIARPVPAVRPLARPTRGRTQPAALPSQDASIPLERVPYFRSDLRRIAVTAAVMFVLLIAGSIVLRNLLLA